MKRLAIALTGLSVLALTACASLAPYGQQRGSGGQGYSEQRVESNRYRVTYNGVGAAGRVADWALVRAADLTTEQGYDWFEVTQSWTDGRPGGAGGVRPSVSIGGGSSRYGRYSASGVRAGVGPDLTRPQPTPTPPGVGMGPGAKPNTPNAYDARSVQGPIPP
ncbi:CC0125/CC1285 family lipoprotein [Brevundimonas sp. Marseille-Q4549]